MISEEEILLKSLLMQILMSTEIHKIVEINMFIIIAIALAVVRKPNHWKEDDVIVTIETSGIC